MIRTREYFKLAASGYSLINQCRKKEKKNFKSKIDFDPLVLCQYCIYRKKLRPGVVHLYFFQINKVDIFEF